MRGHAARSFVSRPLAFYAVALEGNTPMTDLILHHYEMSPYSEKVRRMLAFTGLGWQSVRAPAVMPKPDLTALTGGYRKIPVLQRGNHVYCDTALIARVLGRLAPRAGLFADPMAETLAEWADSALFELVVPTAMRPTRLDDLMRWMTPDELSALRDDRQAMRADAPKKPLRSALAGVYLAQYLERLDHVLATRAFLLGDAACVADFAAYHATWFLERVAPEPLAPHANLRAWMGRIAAIGPSGEGPALSSSDALSICRASTTQTEPPATWSDPMQLAYGELVRVRALDYGREPVEGQLVGSAPNELTLRREDERAGTVFVHFPRLGYEIEPLAARER